MHALTHTHRAHHHMMMPTHMHFNNKPCLDSPIQVDTLQYDLTWTHTDTTKTHISAD